MFTPPQSPTPPRVARSDGSDSPGTEDSASLISISSSSSSSSTPRGPPLALAPPPTRRQRVKLPKSAEIKKRTARRTRWTIFLVPVVLILITLSTRYVSHPAALDLLSSHGASKGWEEWASSVTRWRVHKRHPNPEPQAGGSAVISFATPTSSSTSAAVPSSSSTGTQTIPPIPASPPVLPTPFPQPLDTTLSQNFSTVVCQNFFSNMTQSQAFRSCRPFSLLQDTSAEFIQAQDNLTALNDILWGTCNTDIGVDQCVANMGWFSSTLQTQCATDLANKNSMAITTLKGLQAYSLLRDTACLADPNTNAYCYIEAVSNTNPSDLYFYQLPLGTALPNTVKPSCSSCTKSVMALYSQAQNVTALASTYPPAAQLVNAGSACGSGYAPESGLSGSAMGLRVPAVLSWVLVGFGILLVW